MCDRGEALDHLYCCAPHRSWTTENPEYVLFDFKLPTVNVLDVLQRIEVDPNMKTVLGVMLSSHGGTRPAEKLQSLHERLHRGKAMSLQTFINTIREVRLFWDAFNQAPSTAERDL